MATADQSQQPSPEEPTAESANSNQEDANAGSSVEEQASDGEAITSGREPSEDSGEMPSGGTPIVQVWTRGRTKRKMLRGEAKKQYKELKRQAALAKGPIETAAPDTQKTPQKKRKKRKKKPGKKVKPPEPVPGPSDSAAPGKKAKKKRKRVRKPKEALEEGEDTAPPRRPRKLKFRFEDKIVPIIGLKRQFKTIIDFTQLYFIALVDKRARKDSHIPDYLPERNQDHGASKAWEVEVQKKLASAGYSRVDVSRLLLQEEIKRKRQLVNQPALQNVPESGTARKRTSSERSQCPPNCTCSRCTGTAGGDNSNPSSRQGKSRRGSTSDSEIDILVPAGPKTWTRDPKTATETSMTKSDKPRRGKAGPKRPGSTVGRSSVSPRTRKNTRNSLLVAQTKEVQRLRMMELLERIKVTVTTAQLAAENLARARAVEMALRARDPMRFGERPSNIPEGHNVKQWEKTRQTMRERGVFPTGAPDPPTWTQYVEPGRAAPTHPNNWWVLNPNELAVDPMYAEKMSKILERFPQVRNWRGVLPPYPVPGKRLTLENAQFVIPNLDELPKQLLLDYVEFVQQGDIRLNGPPYMTVGYDSELLLLYMEVWNRRCAIRESILWSLGMETTVGWAGGLMKIDKVEDVKRLYPNLAPETVKWIGILVKGFCRMPVVVGPRPDVWVHPRGRSRDRDPLNPGLRNLSGFSRGDSQRSGDRTAAGTPVTGDRSAAGTPVTGDRSAAGTPVTGDRSAAGTPVTGDRSAAGTPVSTSSGRPANPFNVVVTGSSDRSGDATPGSWGSESAGKSTPVFGTEGAVTSVILPAPAPPKVMRAASFYEY